ncbi:glycosyltransferase [Roseiconus nitratireducens]|uniref:Glycosyltransferase n=1 Tax=Roseiconus nitratireducens TaxID=2605748 RepID=A0A5M6D934_9BACT|nr:glycosyltransferase [Roseiconus nitratireducens]KAA5543136.1 glycosyltransferase [Roseiconus nitratireducens]
MRSLYFFGWPSRYGGADTKAAHLLGLLAGHLKITVVPNFPEQLEQSEWTTFLDSLQIRYTSLDRLPGNLSGVALALCNDQFFVRGLHREAIKRGLKVIWSSEMMWHHQQEVQQIKAGSVSRLLYVSEVQKATLNYESFCDVPTRITGNYIDPSCFPFVDRDNTRGITIGRLSRAAEEKYPEDFPVFYEALGIPDARFRVMAWSSALSQKYRWHRFDQRWDLLPVEAEPAASFLQSLDLFVYPLGHQFTESWGRSTVEAMLTGAIPLVPEGHNFGELIVHGETGFLCGDFLEYQEHALRLSREPASRRKMSLACRDHAVTELCDTNRHRECWLEALDV